MPAPARKPATSQHIDLCFYLARFRFPRIGSRESACRRQSPLLTGSPFHRRLPAPPRKETRKQPLRVNSPAKTFWRGIASVAPDPLNPKPHAATAEDWPHQNAERAIGPRTTPWPDASADRDGCPER